MGYEEYSPHHDLSELLDTKSFLSSSPEKYSPATIQSDSELMREAEEFSKMQGYEYETMLKGLKAKRELRKNSLYTNIYGDYIYGLIKHSEDSSLIKSFAIWQVKMAVSPCSLVPSLIEFNKTKVNLSDPFIKRFCRK